MHFCNIYDHRFRRPLLNVCGLQIFIFSNDIETVSRDSSCRFCKPTPTYMGETRRKEKEVQDTLLKV